MRPRGPTLIETDPDYRRTGSRPAMGDQYLAGKVRARDYIQSVAAAKKILRTIRYYLGK